MGILFVLIFWAGFGAVVAIVGGIVAGRLASRLTRGTGESRKRLVGQAALFPLYCVLWAALVFIFQATINAVYFHRDIGIGDSSRCTFPNGYALLMIDVADEGILYNPKTQNDEHGVASTEDTVDYVRTMQVAGRYILGGQGSSNRLADTSPVVASWFILDTANGTHPKFASYDLMTDAARHLGIQPALRPIFDVYSENRFGWFDGSALALLAIPPLIATGFFVAGIARLRKTSPPTPLPA